MQPHGRRWKFPDSQTTWTHKSRRYATVTGNNTIRTAALIRKFSPLGVEDSAGQGDFQAGGADAAFYSIARATDGSTYVAGGQFYGGQDWHTWVKKLNRSGVEITSGWDKT